MKGFPTWPLPMQEMQETQVQSSGGRMATQYSCLENPMDGGAWWATVHGVAKSWTRLNIFTFFSFFLQFSSVAQLCPTLCDTMNCSTPGLPVHHQLPKFTQTHVHWVGEAIQPSHPLLSPSPPPPIYPSIRVFSNEPTLRMRWPKYWSFSFSIIPSKEQPGPSPLEWTDWISLQSKGLSRVFSNTTVQKHQFFSAQLSSQPNSHIHTWLLEKPQPWLDGP